jgi:hypothetical protein
MTRDDRFIGQLEDYLDGFDGETPLPGHVRDAVRAELPRTRQVHPRRGPARVFDIMSNLTSSAPYGIAAAAIVIAVAGGAWLIAGRPGDVGTVPPDPTPSPAPSTPTTPVPSELSPPLLTLTLPLVECPDGSMSCIAAGTYALGLDVGGRQLHVDVPEGWFPFITGSGFSAILAHAGPDAPEGSGWGVAFMEVGQVYRDPCDMAAGTWSPDETDTPEKLVAAMRAWPGFAVSDAQPTTVAGADGLMVSVTSTRSLDDCPVEAIWQAPLGVFTDAYPMVGPAGVARAGTFRIVDAGDELLVVRTTEFADSSPFEIEQGVADDPERHAADLAGQQSIVDSARFAPEGQ